ncbi:MAG TPA: DUF308 domain-containing protein [Gaiellaceae bacterium]|jgi:uncharacterized membrane protein HdeD (DUF308 family)
MVERASPLSLSDRQTLADAGRVWWLFLVTGTLWLLFSIIVFRFDYTTVSAISILFGILMLAAAVMEVAAVFLTHGWRRLGHGLLTAAFAVLAIVSFVHPGDTFKALAAVMSFYFILKGTFDLVLAIATRPEDDMWWLGLTIGIIEILLGFWAAGDFGNKVILLVIWVGAIALTRGISEIVFAFTLRSMRSDA